MQEFHSWVSIQRKPWLEKIHLLQCFIAALYTIAKTWKQPKCPLTEEWIKKMWYIYTMEYYSAIKRKEIMAFAATWMDLEIIMLSEVSQTVRQHHILSLTVESKKRYNELLCRTDTDYRLWKNYCFQRRLGEGGGDGLGVWDGNAIIFVMLVV